MKFVRAATDKWRNEIPGARWFKGDLQVHTIDDRRIVSMPSELQSDPSNPETLRRYARLFLQSVVGSGVQVVGLTPHSPFFDDNSRTRFSAVWRIIEEWNSGEDDDGNPFRNKIFAIFPGFEPSLREGKAGLHLLFLFDPEIGKQKYFEAFNLIMGGIQPWQSRGLSISKKRAEEVFQDIHNIWESDCQTDESRSQVWNYIILSPHAGSDKGLIGAHRGQVRERFNTGPISALELGDNQTPEEMLGNHSWLSRIMEMHRQAFFHSSDAKRLEAIGTRHTWFKLSSPSIEALRQAFIAGESRVRIGFSKEADGILRPIADPPCIEASNRPWLRAAHVLDGASFFGSIDGNTPTESVIPFSPDLTCIIGGSMTGKSTLLDGLRVRTGAPLPLEESVKSQVLSRALKKFRAKSPNIKLDCPGQDPTAPDHERWPAQFFAQNELQHIAQSDGAIEHILARLSSREMEGIKHRHHKLLSLDRELAELAENLDKLDESVGEAVQACLRTGNAKNALDAFSEAGVDRLHDASNSYGSWEETAHSVQSSLVSPIEQLVQSAEEIELPTRTNVPQRFRSDDPIDWQKKNLKERKQQIVKSLRALAEEIKEWSIDIDEVASHKRSIRDTLRLEVEQELAAQGYDANKLTEIQSLTRQASLFSSYAKHRDALLNQVSESEQVFTKLLKTRHKIVVDQRSAFSRVAQDVNREFRGKIRVVRIDNANNALLEDFITSLRKSGVTRWWNDNASTLNLSPERLVASLDSNSLGGMGMSVAIQNTFKECITRSKRRELLTLRCPDRYDLEWRMDNGSHRPLKELSGGQRVGILLSLLLETVDDRPLVVDQPEDEIDNRFLFDTVLPALKRLRGRRQVIVATHNANVVVNGDADLVIQLDATALRGKVECVGAIEETDVREAIVRIVDGGKEAFDLRRRKYGF